MCIRDRDRYEVDSTKFDNIQAMKAGGIINDSGKVKDGVVINAYYAPCLLYTSRCV